MSDAMRLDMALTHRGLTASRSKAQSLIRSGNVYVNGKPCQKASLSVLDTDQLEIRGEQCPFVSRGGYKLLKAIDTFHISLDGLVCMDVGASTGGFTDCMLQHGAKKVYAVDVGTDQLAEKLRMDERVVCKEQCNFRYATRNEIPEEIDFASVDVSFISLGKILPTLYQLLSLGGQAVCLIKPQFEAGRENLSKNGVVRNKNVHIRVIDGVLREISSVGFGVLGLTHSPIKGPMGNIEYLVYITKAEQNMQETDPEIIVKNAHKELGENE
jgi:23S rRNA (cytidine1920-2'-O)/16S rRNA (cytidine1409-2'-O)-methyltransferase